jgi:hypothetical protein
LTNSDAATSVLHSFWINATVKIFISFVYAPSLAKNLISASFFAWALNSDPPPLSWTPQLARECAAE